VSEETKPVPTQQPAEARAAACTAEIKDILERYVCRLQVVQAEIDGAKQPPQVNVVSR